MGPRFGEGRSLLPLPESNRDRSFFKPICTMPFELSSLLGTRRRHTVTDCTAPWCAVQSVHDCSAVGRQIHACRHRINWTEIEFVWYEMCCSFGALVNFNENVASAAKVKTVTNCTYRRP